MSDGEAASAYTVLQELGSESIASNENGEIGNVI